MVATGAGFLWLGWNGFNGGDPYFAGASASAAVSTPTCAPRLRFLVWVAWDLIYNDKPSLIGTVNGMITGLVGITPAAVTSTATARSSSVWWRPPSSGCRSASSAATGCSAESTTRWGDLHARHRRTRRRLLVGLFADPHHEYLHRQRPISPLRGSSNRQETPRCCGGRLKPRCGDRVLGGVTFILLKLSDLAFHCAPPTRNSRSAITRSTVTRSIRPTCHSRLARIGRNSHGLDKQSSSITKRRPRCTGAAVRL